MIRHGPGWHGIRGQRAGIAVVAKLGVNEVYSCSWSVDLPMQLYHVCADSA